jgi:hypothetical protein
VSTEVDVMNDGAVEEDGVAMMEDVVVGMSSGVIKLEIDMFRVSGVS